MKVTTLLDTEMETFSSRAAALNSWWQGPCGRYLTLEQARMLEQLPAAGGYHELQLSSFGHTFTKPGEKLGHSFALHPVRLTHPLSAHSGALADFSELPLPSGVIDRVLLHHALDYSRRPREVLAESSRVLAEGGQLTLLAFNSHSPWGSCAPWLSNYSSLERFGFACAGRFHRLSTARLLDWLALLQLQVATVSYGAYNPPLPWRWAQSSDRSWQRWLAKHGVPVASCVVIHAVKRSAARLHSGTPTWRSKQILPVVGKKNRRPAATTQSSSDSRCE
ncbi:MAG: class I SAM-dependent methyltransferase [Porticoccaceae bacterium]